MNKKERFALLRELLNAAYPDAVCSLRYTKPLEMLIATPLSAQCNDSRVNIVTKDLFRKYKTVEDCA
ncbi:MAG: endonuclease III, partial [Clostridia bacterium]|nr:endonuclease III [Clostridia bacterium]